MKFLLVILTILGTLLSCTKESNLVVFDNYYNSFYELSESKNYDYINIEFNELSTLNLHSYSTIVTSPLLYRLNKTVWDEYEGSLKILEPFSNYNDGSRIGVRVSDIKCYKDIYNIISYGRLSDKVERICFIYDGYSSSGNSNIPSLESMEAKYLINKLKKNKIVIDMKVDASTSVEVIDDFINKTDGIDLWIVNSDTYSLTIYELINVEDNVIINENSFFDEKNRNIIYTIDKDLKKNIDIILENSINEIYSILKSY